MRLTDVFDEVARRADTPKTQINVAVTSRVIGELFGVLAERDSVEVSELVAKGMATARRRAAKARAKAAAAAPATTSEKSPKRKKSSKGKRKAKA